MRPRTQALLLVGHGSQLGAETGEPVRVLARTLREEGSFDEVGVAFWKEEPSLRDGLRLLVADDLYVVPVLMAEGYFDRVVVPRELGLSARGGPSRVRYCPPVGGHPAMADLVEASAREALAPEGVAPGETELVLIGHGTPLHRSSGRSAEAAAERLRARGSFRAVRVAYLDQDPGVEGVVAGAARGRVVLVPFFLSGGWHTRHTIPRALGLEGRRSERDGRVLHYAEPVGTSARLSELVLDLASRAGAEVVGGRRRRRARGSPAMAEWVASSGPRGRALLQALVRPDGNGAYEVLHVEDADTARAVLAPADAATLERLAGGTGGRRHRPLRAAPDLPRGWVLRGLDAAGAARALATLYPADPARWEARRGGRLPVVPWGITAARQTGRYSGVGALAGAALGRAVRACCGTAVCLRTPEWAGACVSAGASASAAARHDADTPAPCPETCTLFVSFARSVLALERRWPRAGVGVAPEAAVRIGSTLRRAAGRLARGGCLPVAGFEEALNPRRLRYLAGRLAEGADDGPVVARWGLDVRGQSSGPALPTLAVALGVSLGVEALATLAEAGAESARARVVPARSGRGVTVRVSWSGHASIEGHVRPRLSRLARRGAGGAPAARILLASVPPVPPGACRSG